MRFGLIRWSPALVVVAWLVATAGGTRPSAPSAPQLPLPVPHVTDYEQMTNSATPPTQAQCASAGRRCFAPQAIRAAYNLQPLYDAGKNGRGRTIAIIDSYGNDNMAHDLHVFNQAFGLPPLCGEEGVACAPGMPWFH